MDEIIQKILKMLEHQNCSSRYLLDKLKMEKEELNTVLTYMKKNRLIYLNSNNKISKVLDGQLVGRIDSDSKGRKFIRNKNSKYFIEVDNLHTALKNDLVVCDVYNQDLANVLGIIERKNKRLVCEIVKKHNKLGIAPFNVGCELSLMPSNKDVLKNYVEGDRIIVELENTVDDDNVVVVHTAKRIGHKDDPKSDEIAIAISKDFDVDFSPESMKEALEIPNFVSESEKKGRLDLTNDVIFTIDSVHTKDMDDAISIKKIDNGNYLLGVHIADVAHYVKPGSTLFEEARKRATSLYLGDTVIPMLPHKLSNGICSLNEGVDRLTKSCFIEIDSKGKIIDYKIVDSVINSKKKMTYEELNAIFQNGTYNEDYIPFLKELCHMRNLSNILTNTREKRGNIDFESNDIKVTNDKNQNPIEFISRSNEEAETLIENFMIMANEVVATHFYWQNLPFIYRVHNYPDEEKVSRTLELIQTLGPKLIKLQNAYGQKEIQNILNEYKGTPEYSVISNLLLKNMAKAKYSTERIGHFALALDNYCHFTSPIRRFPDLAIHSLLDLFNKDYLKNDNYELQSKLQEISEHSSYKERQADDAERDYLKLKMAEYMKEHLGEEFDGTIMDIDGNSVHIKLDNNVRGVLAYTGEFSEAFSVDSNKKEIKSLYSKTVVKLGTRVTVKAHEVNVPAKEIFLELIEIHKTKQLIKKNN